MDKSDTDALRNAVQLLEHASLAARLANMIGKPVELLGRALPAGASQAIATATTKSLEAALKVALLTIRGGPQESSQLLHRALAVASRFGFVVSQKVAAQTIPVIGALGGAAINYAFIDHFQSVARGHFTVRRLERKYGKDLVFNVYERLRQDLGTAR